MEKILFAKVRENAIIPSKNTEDAGYDLYACFEEEFITITKGETVIIQTGIASAFSKEYMFLLEERGSTGINGMSIRCGVVDSGYRGEWAVIINNTSDVSICITKSVDKVVESPFKLYYPYEKAIAQAVFLQVPKTEIEVISFEDLKLIESVRCNGRFGSSGK